MNYLSRFLRAADAAAEDNTFDAVRALLGPDMSAHEAINGNVAVEDIAVHLNDTQMSALGLDDADDEAEIVGYSTDDGFALKTAKKVEA